MNIFWMPQMGIHVRSLTKSKQSLVVVEVVVAIVVVVVVVLVVAQIRSGQPIST